MSFLAVIDPNSFGLVKIRPYQEIEIVTKKYFLLFNVIQRRFLVFVKATMLSYIKFHGFIVSCVFDVIMHSGPQSFDALVKIGCVFNGYQFFINISCKNI